MAKKPTKQDESAEVVEEVVERSPEEIEAEAIAAREHSEGK